MGTPKRRSRSRGMASVESIVNALPPELLDIDQELRDILPGIGAWLRVHMFDPGLALDVANAAGLSASAWFRHRLSKAPDDHPVLRRDAYPSPEPPPAAPRPKPDLRVV